MGTLKDRKTLRIAAEQVRKSQDMLGKRSLIEAGHWDSEDQPEGVPGSRTGTGQKKEEG